MRWLFCEPGAADYGQKAAAQQRIEAWWQAFAPRVGDITALFSRKKDWDLAGWMGQTLQAVHPEMMWEYGPAVRGGGHRLVITPESARHLRPLAAAILKSAPQLPGWEFYNYRLPEDVEQAEYTVQGRCHGTLEGILVRPTVAEAKRIDLQFFSPRASRPHDERALPEIYVATEALLGEELLDHWIGAIDVEPLPKPGMLGGVLGKPKPTNLLPLARLHDTVQAVIASVTEQLQSQPLWQTIESKQWAVYNAEPEEVEDYAGRDDVLAGGTVDTNLIHAMLPGNAFFSGRFSRAGERFCYLKLDGEGQDISERFEMRGELEDALNDALIPRQLGCHVGGATGLRYTYVDLALTDVRKAIEILRLMLEDHCSHRSWLLFHDADLCGEWVGIYPDSPPPPMAQE